MLCGRQDGLFGSLRTGILHALPVLETNLPHLYWPPTRLAVVKTDSPNIYMPTKSFAVVKINYLNYYMPTPSFAIVKSDSPCLYSHLDALW